MIMLHTRKAAVVVLVDPETWAIDLVNLIIRHPVAP